MQITGSLDQGIYHLTLIGRFSFTDHMEFREVIHKIKTQEVRQVTLHMQQLEHIDSAALGMLLLAHEESLKYHKKIIISGAVGLVKKTLEVTKLNTLFEMD